MRSLCLFLGLTLIAIGQNSLQGSSHTTSAKAALPNMVFGMLQWLSVGTGAWVATIIGILLAAHALVPRRRSGSSVG
jgi:hypothetical protein